MAVRVHVQGLLVAAAWVAAGCSGSTTSPTTPPPATSVTRLVSVSPMGGMSGVADSTRITLMFSGPMAAGMEQYMDLHVGAGVAGSTVPMNCVWSTDLTRLTCTPGSPLQPHSEYTIHVGAGMMDADGHPMDMGPDGQAMGGSWIPSGGMMGGMHDGQPMGMMGAGWTSGGTIGMEFVFATG